MCIFARPIAALRRTVPAELTTMTHFHTLQANGPEFA
jgi:hypothetical protein